MSEELKSIKTEVLSFDKLVKENDALRKQLEAAIENISEKGNELVEDNKRYLDLSHKCDALRKQLEVATRAMDDSLHGEYTWGQQLNILHEALAEIERIEKEGKDE